MPRRGVSCFIRRLVDEKQNWSIDRTPGESRKNSLRCNYSFFFLYYFFFGFCMFPYYFLQIIFVSCILISLVELVFVPATGCSFLFAEGGRVRNHPTVLLVRWPEKLWHEVLHTLLLCSGIFNLFFIFFLLIFFFFFNLGDCSDMQDAC